MKAGLCVLVMAGMAFTASAQSAQNPGAAIAPPAEETVSTHQLAQILASPKSEERSYAFERVLYFAYFRPDVDLGPTVPALVDVCKNDPDKRYRLLAVSALHAIGEETGMQQIRQRFAQEPSLLVQYVAVHALLDYYGPQAFAGDPEALALAKNVLARRREIERLVELQRLLRLARVEVGPLEVTQPDSSW